MNLSVPMEILELRKLVRLVETHLVLNSSSDLVLHSVAEAMLFCIFDHLDIVFKSVCALQEAMVAAAESERDAVAVDGENTDLALLNDPEGEEEETHEIDPEEPEG